MGYSVVLTEDAPVESRRCKSCNAEIVWAITLAGKRMPVDLARRSNGNLVLYRETLMEELVGPHRVRIADGFDRQYLKGNLWISHFVTCPNAAQHRREL